MHLLLAVYHEYLPQFLGEEDLAQLASQFEKVTRIEPELLSEQQWVAMFAEQRPDAVVSCWGTRAVPAEAMPKLKYVAHLCGSVRNLVTRDMIERGLWVTNWGNIHAKPVAECALLLTLCTLRKTTRWTLAMHRDRLWPHEALHQSCTLLGRRVGLHGFGSIARELIQFLKPFGCPISAYSAGVPDEWIRQHGATPVKSLQELFSNVDVLIEVEALTPASRHSVTEDLLRMLPAGASFVNVGRGAVVDEAALIRVALEGRLEIAMDVYEAEPMPADSPLRGLPNVTLSPHIGGPTADMRRGCGARAVKNLLRFARGEKPDETITPELYDRAT